jgi:hypothetical protein
MTDYNNYIARLKKEKTDVDYDRMFARVLQRSARKPCGMRLALAGALALLLIGFGLYFASGQNSRLASNTDEDLLTTYVFDESENIDGPVLDYVL